MCMAGSLNARVVEKRDGGETLLSFDLSGPVLDQAIAEHGVMPLPPYIASKRAPDNRDLTDYQTIYAAREGAVAAPTAGLHFTEPLLSKLRDRGLDTGHVTLHVGAGTFLPVKAETTEDHQMHAEWGEVSEDVVQQVADAKARGGRVVAVGTTSLRLLEAASVAAGRLGAFSGETDIFITPGFTFRTVDMLITKFSPAAFHPIHAGLRLLRHGCNEARLCACDRGGIPFLLLRRCLPLKPRGTLNGRT